MAQAIETVHAYCAGLIDGEGCITIGCRNRYRSSQQIVKDYWLSVVVVTKDEHLPRWLFGHYGGNLNIVQRKETASYKAGQYKRWVVSTDRAYEVLRHIRPYLILKQRQCDTAMEFQRLYRRFRWYQKPDYVLDKFDGFFQELKRLKRAAVETKFSEPFVKTASDSPASEQSEHS